MAKRQGLLKFGLLALLADHPNSGYGLGKLIFRDQRPALSLVYRKLNNMYEEGLVEVERVVEGKAPYKNVFSITRKGRKELERWLKDPNPPYPLRDPLMFQVWFGKFVEPKYILNDLIKYKEKLILDFNYYDEIRKQTNTTSRTDGDSDLEILYHTLVNTYSVRSRQLTSDWVDYAIASISAFNAKERSSGDK